MLPYTQLQLAYALGTLLATWLLWRASGRLSALTARPWSRLCLVACALLVAALATGVVVGTLFATIAVVFYTGALGIPALLLAQAARDSRGRNLSVALALILAGVAAYAAFVEPNDLRVSERELAFEAWPADAAPFTLVQIGDLQTVGPCARQDEAVARINALEPDLIAICGDYIAGPFFDPEPAIASARAFLSALRAKHGVVCVKGHSEPTRLRLQIFEGLAVRYLDDEEFTLELGPGQRLRVIGLGYDVPKFRPRRGDGLLTVAISHVPDQSSRLIGSGVHLHLAGHTHGGQIVVPGFGAPITLSRLPREYARGLFRFGFHWLSVTPGIGMEGDHAPRVRLFCPPQIDVFHLKGGGEHLEWIEPPYVDPFTFH